MSFIIGGERSFKKLYISVIRMFLFFKWIVNSLDISRSSEKRESLSLYVTLRARSYKFAYKIIWLSGTKGPC